MPVRHHWRGSSVLNMITYIEGDYWKKEVRCKERVMIIYI